MQYSKLSGLGEGPGYFAFQVGMLHQNIYNLLAGQFWRSQSGWAGSYPAPRFVIARFKSIGTDGNIHPPSGNKKTHRGSRYWTFLILR